MKFLYNMWQSFKRNAVLHLLTLVMLVIIFYIGTSIVSYKQENDDFFEKCGYNQEFGDSIVVFMNQDEFKSNERYQKFVMDNNLNKLGCSANFSFNIGGASLGTMISPLLPQALKLKNATGNFSSNYVGNGVDKPYEIMFRKDNTQYQIGKVYELPKENSQGEEEIVKVKVVGYFEDYSIELGFAEFRGLFTKNYANFLICGEPEEEISYCFIVDSKDYPKYASVLDSVAKDKKSLKEIYDIEYKTSMSVVLSDIIKVVLAYLILVATILSFNFYKYDNMKKYNNIKKIVGENKLTNVGVEVAINVLVFVLSLIIVSVIGLIEPELFGSLPNIGFGVCVGVVGITYFGMLAVSLYKVNNFLKVKVVKK